MSNVGATPRRFEPMIERSVVRAALALGAIAVVLVGFWYLALRSGDNSDASAQREISPAAQLRAYRILHAPEQKAPPYIEASVRKTVAKARGALRIWSSHLATTAYGGIWVLTGRISGEGVGCIAQVGRAVAACVPTAEMVRNGLALGIVKHPSKPPHAFLLIGIAPDRVRAVRATVGVGVGAATRTIPVRNNAYAIRARVPILVEGLCAVGQRCERLAPVRPSGD